MRHNGSSTSNGPAWSATNLLFQKDLRTIRTAGMFVAFSSVSGPEDARGNSAVHTKSIVIGNA